MYSINGQPLDNPTFGWTLLRRTQLLTGVTKNLSTVTVPGRNGAIQGIPAFKGVPSATLVIRTPDTGLEALYAVFEKNGGRGLMNLTEDTSRVAEFELASIDPQGINAEDELINVTVTIRFPTADWRDTAQTITAPATPGSPVSTFNVLAGIGSDIADGDIFIGGGFGNMELRDIGSGSWIKTVITWPTIAGTGLLYVGSTGQAYRANTATPWTPTADMSQYVTVSGGGGFRVTPTWTTNPSDRIAKVELTTTSQSGVTFRVRAFNAYALRNGGI
jgi:hypothetical protein